MRKNRSWKKNELGSKTKFKLVRIQFQSEIHEKSSKANNSNISMTTDNANLYNIWKTELGAKHVNS